MRPRKIILYVDDNESSRSIMKFTLEICGFRVVVASNGQEAIDIFCSEPVDLVLSQAWLPRDLTGFATIHKMKQIASHVPMVLLGFKSDVDRIHCADAILSQSSLSTAELLDRVKVMSARKRGPRKGSTKRPVSSVKLADVSPKEIGAA